MLLLFVPALLAASTARYHIEPRPAPRDSVVTSFSISSGPAEHGNQQWISLSATKANGATFQLWLLSAGYPSEPRAVSRYILQEGSAQPREYRHALTGQAVLPPMGGWQHLLPRPAGFPPEVRYLGHRYVRESLSESVAPPPPAARIVSLRPDVLIGPPSNTRQKDETRRYDESDYELIRLTLPDYREMAAAGINCVSVDDEQAAWADDLGLFYWGRAARLPYPEFLYRSQYLGPALFLDEPAVSTRDSVIRPRLAKEPAFRKAITPQIVFDAFRTYYDHALREGAPTALRHALAARPDIDPGDMNFPQENLYTWETMVASSAYQLSRDPRVPAAVVFEPPGRIGTRRTLPEIDMTYGVQLPPDDPKAFADLLFGFLRGAARLTSKGWGVSIYGSVQRADTFFWFTHAYDLGATRFFFWDNARLACVPYGEVLALSRHLRGHSLNNPERDLDRLRRAAEVVILLPPGYNLGHVHMGKGDLWGIGELNLDRVNRHGIPYRAVMSNFFTEIERCFRLGVAYDLLWDLPGHAPTGYRELIRIREDGKVEVHENGRATILDHARIPPRPKGEHPKLSLTVTTHPTPDAIEVTADAKVEETSSPIYYTLGADPTGVYHNAMVAWELYGPGEEDYQFLSPPNLRPQVHREGRTAHVVTTFKLPRTAAHYRLRASTVDQSGRPTTIQTKLGPLN